MADLGKLPENVMMEIVSRLPLESLVRFKCVSKLWYALINDPRCVLLMRDLTNTNFGSEEVRFSFLKYDPFVTSLEIEDAKFPSFVYEESPRFTIRGHSHGLVCLYGTGSPSPIYLYNPATGDVHKLPPSILLFDDFDFSIRRDLISIENAIGFGYDRKSKDFKVVRTVDYVPSSVQLYDLEPPEDVEVYNHFLPSKAEVYDLKKGEWREIETPIPGRVFWRPSTTEMFYQGFYYWWGLSKEGRRAEIILSFDMGEEVFRLISLPESLEKEDYCRNLGVLNGSIILFYYPLHEAERSFEIWEMEKSRGGVVSWSKLFAISTGFYIERPLTFLGSNQLLMKANDQKLLLYNINTQQFKSLSFQTKSDSMEATLFVNTLLSPNLLMDNNLTIH